MRRGLTRYWYTFARKEAAVYISPCLYVAIKMGVFTCCSMVAQFFTRSVCHATKSTAMDQVDSPQVLSEFVLALKHHHPLEINRN